MMKYLLDSIFFVYIPHLALVSLGTPELREVSSIEPPTQLLFTR